MELTLSSVDKKSKPGEREVLLCNYMDVYSNALIRSGLEFLPATATAREIERCTIRTNDVLITKDSEEFDDIGVPAFVKEDIQNLLCGYHLAILRPFHSVVDGRYLYYALQIPSVQNQFHAFANGVTRFSLRKDDILRIEVPIHEFSEQQIIGQVLGILDEKIDLNRRMNATLEAIAREIFTDWFVDFGPVHAKMKGRKPYLPSDLWDLFPDALNKEGKPVGWIETSLGSTLSVLETGNRPRGGVAHISEGIPSVGAESIVGVGVFDFSKTKFVPLSYYANMKRGRARSGDVLVYKDGARLEELQPLVTYISCEFPFSEFCINEHVFRVRTHALSQQLLYCFLTSLDASRQMRELATKSAQPGLTQEAMRSISFTLPKSSQILQAAQSLIDPLIDRCNRNSANSRVLANTRDLLVPKLISGGVTHKYVENLLGNSF